MNNKIEKQEVVSFATAKTLKEKGFMQPTYAMYGFGTKECYDNLLGNHNQTSWAIAAPSLFQAKKWIEEKYKLYISLEYNFKRKKYKFTANKENGGLLATKFIFESEQDALEVAFDMIINSIKMKYEDN